MKLKKLFVTSVALLAVPAFAAQPDYTVLTDAVDWTAVGQGFLAIGAAFMGLYVAQKGIMLIVRMLRGG